MVDVLSGLLQQKYSWKVLVAFLVLIFCELGNFCGAANDVGRLVPCLHAHRQLWKKLPKVVMIGGYRTVRNF